VPGASGEIVAQPGEAGSAFANFAKVEIARRTPASK
jgi:hypothetical protein